MIVIIILVIALLFITKLLDVISTLQKIRTSMDETNPFVCKIMPLVGTKSAVWLVFLITMVIVGLAGYIALRGGRLTKGTFVIAGLFISIVQAAVAHANWSGRDNAITRFVRKVYLRIGR